MIAICVCVCACACVCVCLIMLYLALHVPEPSTRTLCGLDDSVHSAINCLLSQLVSGFIPPYFCTAFTNVCIPYNTMLQGTCTITQLCSSLDWSDFYDEVLFISQTKLWKQTIGWMSRCVFLLTTAWSVIIKSWSFTGKQLLFHCGLYYKAMNYERSKVTLGWKLNSNMHRVKELNDTEWNFV
jgi:hypothetical protein